MENTRLYQDIAKRTDGDIYVGVVGPVRTGKSTFIKKFMDLLVIPNIDNEYKKERAKDELPQSAGGKTIMTTERVENMAGGTGHVLIKRLLLS